MTPLRMWWAQRPNGHSWLGGRGWPNGRGGERVVVAVRDSSEAEHLLRRATVLAGPADTAEVVAVHVSRNGQPHRWFLQ